MISPYNFNLNQYNDEYYRIYEATHNLSFDTIPSFKLLKDFLNIQDGDVVLDAGCGSGHLVNYIVSGYSVDSYGIDFSETALKLAKTRYGSHEYIKADLHKISFHDESFDKILCFNVIEHILEQDSVMHEFHRILKKDGLIVLGTNIKDSIQWWLYQKFIGEHTHINEFTVNEFTTFCAAHFAVLDYKKSSGVFRFRPPASWIFHYLLKGDIIVKCKKLF